MKIVADVYNVRTGEHVGVITIDGDKVTVAGPNGEPDEYGVVRGALARWTHGHAGYRVKTYRDFDWHHGKSHAEQLLQAIKDEYFDNGIYRYVVRQV